SPEPTRCRCSTHRSSMSTWVTARGRISSRATTGCAWLPTGRWCCGSRADDARRTKGGTALATRMIPGEAHPYMAISPPGVVDEMLAELRLDELDELFEQIPESHRLSKPIELPPALRAEAQLKRHLTEILSR